MEYIKWKEVVKKNYHQLVFVFIAFLLMIAVSIISVNYITSKKLLSASEEALYTVEANIKTNLGESEATLVSSVFAVQNMIVNQNASSEEVLQYLEALSGWFMENDGRISGFNGIYGVVMGSYLDGTGWEPSADYIPEKRPWYLSAIENGGEIAITEPYVDAQTQTGIISLSQQLYDAKGEFLGVLSLDVMLTRLTEYICSLQQGYGGYGILLDSNLNIIAHPNRDLAGGPLYELSQNYADVALQLNSGIDISGKIIDDTDGRPMILFFRQLYNGWYVGMLTPSDTYYSEMRRMETILIFLGTALMVILGIILMRLSAEKMRSDAENRLKSSFLARMSHEIRTPMNAILGMVELSLRKELPADVREEAIAVKHAGLNLLSIINDILDFSKIESGHMELVSSDYQFASLLNDVINIIQVRIGETCLEFKTDIDSDLPSVLNGDGVRLQQILLNVLSNAVKYTRKGQVHLSVGGEVDGDIIKLTFVISDTGIGIKEDDLDKLFRDFAQLDTHRNKGIEGTGLGLAITQNLCTLMGGSISVSSKYGKGSVFTVCIPQKISDNSPIKDSIGDAYSEPVNYNIGFSAPTLRILIVDDVEVNLKVAQGLLAPYKAQVERCLSGKDAIALIKETDYDMVFMDHMMPEMDGVEAVKIIRAMKGKRFAQMPIIALTANAVTGMRKMFLENGFNDYLEKPINTAKLNKIMDRWTPEQKRVIFKAEEESVHPLHSEEVCNEKFDDERLDKEKNDSEGLDIIEGFGNIEAFSNIEGLDTKFGIMMIGGMQEQYLEVLALFCRDVDERMDILAKPPEPDNLSLFITQVHALKSALASIGASPLSKEAAALESAGLKKSMGEIEQNLDIFRKRLLGLRESIGKAISGKNNLSEESCAIDKSILINLKAALEQENDRLIDDLLTELSRQNYSDEINDSLAKLSEHILMYDFNDAIEIINNLFKECK